MNLGIKNSDADTENRCRHGGSKGDGMHWETGIDIYTLPWVK